MSKKHYYIVVDVETTSTYKGESRFDLVYDCGIAVCDRMGTIYEKKSYILRDIFHKEKLMSSAYYAKKIPQYEIDIQNGIHKEVSLNYLKKVFQSLIEKYNVVAVCAYNASFDRRALNSTALWFSKGMQKFFPDNMPFYCIWHMAAQVICNKKGYIDFCKKNNFVSERGNISTSAETVYKFLSKDPDFTECHTGLKDVEIEVAIMTECFRKHEKMQKGININCWKIPQEKASRA